MRDAARREAHALCIWRKRWIAQKKQEAVLIAVLGICFAVFFGVIFASRPEGSSFLALVIVIMVFIAMLAHEFKALRARRMARVTVAGYGELIEKSAFSKHAITRSRNAQGHYATVRMAHGDEEVLCDARTYASSRPGDWLLVLNVNDEPRLYGVAAHFNDSDA